MSNANFTGLKPLAGSLDYSELPASGGQDKYNRVVREAQKTRTLIETIRSSSVSAGGGLTGGGNFGSNKLTISLGTPSTLVAGASPAPSGSTHSHGFITPNQTEATNGAEDTKVITPLSASWAVTGRIATNAQSIAGTVTDRILSPEGNILYVNNRKATTSQVIAGTNNTNLVTTKKVEEYVDGNIATEQEVITATNDTKFVLEKDIDGPLESNIDPIAEEAREQTLRYARSVVKRGGVVISNYYYPNVIFTSAVITDATWIGGRGVYAVTFSAQGFGDGTGVALVSVSGRSIIDVPVFTGAGANSIAWSPVLGVTVVAHPQGIASSTNLVDWTNRLIGPRINRVIWADSLGLFVAIGDGTYTSSNGINWTLVNPTAYIIKDLIWCEEIGTLLAVGVTTATTSAYFRSTNGGATWTMVASPYIVNAVTYMRNLNRIVSVVEPTPAQGNVTISQYSNDGGATWITVNKPAEYQMKYDDVVWSPELGMLRANTGTVVNVSTDPEYATYILPYSLSTDGINWTHHHINRSSTKMYVGDKARIAWNEDYGSFFEVGVGAIGVTGGITMTSVPSPDWIPDYI